MADKSSELRMNLAAIKRVDPYAKDIIDSSAHVAFYTFNPDETEWEKTDVEGAFFVYSRNAEPYNSVFINNRLNTNSLVEPITAGIELQNQSPFLLYRNERSRIRGFWFYNRTECDRISELVERIVKDSEPLSERHKTGEIASFMPQQAFDLMTYSNNNVDIFSMLSKAQQDFNNSLHPKQPAADSKHGKNEMVEKPKAPPKNVVAAPIQIPLNKSGTSESVLNFFAAAKPSQGTIPIQSRMHSAPVPIDQIEKRVKTPLKEKQATPPQSANAQPTKLLGHAVKTTYAKAAASSGVENGLSFMRITSPTHKQSASVDLGTSPLATFIASNNLAAKTAVVANKEALKPTDIKEIESQHHHTEPLAALLKKPVPVAAATSRSNNTASMPNNAITPNKPALMPPTMFKSTSVDSNQQRNAAANAANTKGAKNESNDTNKKNATPKGKETAKSRKKSAHEQQQQQHQQQQQQQAQSQKSNNDLSLTTAAQPLTQTQLLQAISYLMKNDPDFIRKIHEAYLKSFAEMVAQ